MILRAERSLLGELLVSPIVDRAAAGAIRFVEASEGESVSRNASEPVSAPLSSGSGQPANESEASTDREATSTRSDRAPRGVRGRRAEKDHPGT